MLKLNGPFTALAVYILVIYIFYTVNLFIPGILVVGCIIAANVLWNDYIIARYRTEMEKIIRQHANDVNSNEEEK